MGSIHSTVNVKTIFKVLFEVTQVSYHIQVNNIAKLCSLWRKMDQWLCHTSPWHTHIHLYTIIGVFTDVLWVFWTPSSEILAGHCTWNVASSVNRMWLRSVTFINLLQETCCKVHVFFMICWLNLLHELHFIPTKSKALVQNIIYHVPWNLQFLTFP